MVSKMAIGICEFGAQVVECKVGKASVYIVLAEEMYFSGQK